ncbi:MAG TPA: hypothetical protein VLC09_12855 [Polyangiaceae bacterium]|nr:hypothetical protein [Polyangiaceae bacterium]
MPFERAVNYLGHAAIAQEASRDPYFVLGSMLPDLANMLRVRLPRLDDPRLTDGVRFHERCDAVFHDLPTFIELNHLALDGLRQLGVSRGPARAAAHLGTEFAIDAVLARDPRVASAYVDALRTGAEAPPSLWSPWVPPPEGLSSLLDHLATAGTSIHSVEVARFSTRFGHALAHRPRLAPTEHELAVMSAFCAEHAQRVAERLPVLMVEMRSRLFSAEVETAPR